MVHIILAGLSYQDTIEKLHELVDPSVKELCRAVKRLGPFKRQTKPQAGIICTVEFWI